jgi:predicted amidohydrolase YtcJ
LAGAGDRKNRLRLRIDHFEFPRPDQIERAGRLGLVLAVQPGFAWADDRFVHTYREALAPEVRAAQCPLRSLVDAGCVVSLSTDSPVQPLYPFLQILGAVEHPIAAHRLSRYEALRAYTYNGAYAAFEEHERGSLAIGKYADLALLDADPFAVETEGLRSIQVVGTWHEGQPLAPLPESVLGFAARALSTQPRKL